MKWKAIKLAVEILEEVTSWLTLTQWIILLLTVGILVAVFVPLLVGA